ncbi:unnamed protein product, partial [Closterium sp. NIES-54]
AEPVPKPLPPAQSPRLRQRTQAGSAAFAAAAGAAAVAAAARGGQGAATNGRPGSGGPGRSPMQLPVQKNKLSKYFLPTAPAAKKQFQPPRRSPVTPPVQSAFEPSRPESAAEPGSAGSAKKPRDGSSRGGGQSVRSSAAGQGSAGLTAGEGLVAAGDGIYEPVVGEYLVQFMAGTVLEEQQQQPIAPGPRAAVARVFQRFTPPCSIAEAGTTPEPPLLRRQPYKRAATRATGDRQENTPTEWEQFVFRGNERAQTEGEEETAEPPSPHQGRSRYLVPPHLATLCARCRREPGPR